MPLLRTETGCRCRKTLVSITTTRLRRSRGAGWRKMLFQTWLLRTKSPMAMRGSLAHAPAIWPPGLPGAGAGQARRLNGRCEGFLYTLMYDSGLFHSPRSCWNFLALSTTIWPSSPMLMPQRSRGRGAGLEVDAGDVEAGAVAGALE